MIEGILFFISIISFLLMLVIFYKKIPVLAEVKIKESNNNISALQEKKNRILKISFIKNFSWNIFLQKRLSKMRVIILKIEKKIGDFLHLLRKKSKEK